MKFSIVITTYNRVGYLRAAIASALTQTIPCEIIVVDDCSTDGTQAYVESLGNQVIYHRNRVNLGHSESVNAGVKQATGDWIKFLDDDDYLAPDCIKAMIEAISLDRQAIICSCQAIQINPQGQELRRTKTAIANVAYRVAQEDIHYQMLNEQLPFGTPVQIAVRKDAFLKSGGWDSAFDGNCDDLESWLRISEHGDAIILGISLAYRTIWPGNTSSQLSLKARMETNRLIKEKIYARIHPKYNQSLLPIASIKVFLQLHWGLVGLKRGRIIEGLELIAPLIFSLKAWKDLAKVIYHRFSRTRLQRTTRKITTLEKEINVNSSESETETPELEYSHPQSWVPPIP